MRSSPDLVPVPPPAKPAAAAAEDRLGLLFPLLLPYPIFEYCRPTHPLGIPMVLSSVLFLGWLVQGKKRWPPQVLYFFALIAVMCVGILLAVNTASAFWTTYNLTVTLLGACIPFVHFATSLRKIKLFVYAMLAAFVYCAFYTITHDGVGPGWQDENYAAALMAMAFPFAYFSILAARRVVTRILFVAVAGLFVAAVVVSFSRGGFLGMVIVLLYCAVRSPRRWPLYVVAPVLALSVAAFATPKYWSEMETIDDVHEKTAQLRLDLWAIALRMFEDSPLTGVGPGNFMWNAGDYQTAEQFARYHRSLAASAVTHSVYFELLAEMGVAGVVLFGALLWRNHADLRFVARATGGRAEASPDLQRARYYERAITGSFLAVLTCGATVSIFYYSYLWILTAMTVALKDVTRDLVGSTRREDESTAPAGPWWQRARASAAAGRTAAAGLWLRSGADARAKG